MIGEDSDPEISRMLQIDHKDEPGDYRDRVRAVVLKPFGGRSRRITRPEQLVGDWDVCWMGPVDYKRIDQLRADGTYCRKVLDSPIGPSIGEWRLHPDGSYGEFCWCAPNPELGILEPTLDEEKYFIAAISDKRMVTWNGDGSWVLLWTPRGT